MHRDFPENGERSKMHWRLDEGFFHLAGAWKGAKELGVSKIPS